MLHVLDKSEDLPPIPPPSPPIPSIPFGQALLSVISLVSLIVFFLIVSTILRYRKSSFKSAYYCIFVYHFFCELAMFITVEVILKPRKYNYLGLFHSWVSDVSILPWLSYLLLMHFRSVINLNHALIAYNRYTAFNYKVDQDLFWSRKRLGVIISTIWTVSFIPVLITILYYKDDIFFLKLPNGIIQLYGGTIMMCDGALAIISDVVAVIICTFFYFTSFLQKIDFDSRKNQIKIERKLFICGLFSSVPLLLEMIRGSFLFVAVGNHNQSQIVIITESWFYLIEISISAEAWIQLIINDNLRHKCLALYCLNGYRFLLFASIGLSFFFCIALCIGLITSLEIKSYGQLCLMLFSWVSMTLHISLVLTIFNYKALFNSAYYVLFVYQFVTEFGMFVIVELLLRPRKYNFFGLYSDKMTTMAVFQYSILTHFQIVVYCGHTLFAFNRFTALYFPFIQKKIWKSLNIGILIIVIWLTSFLSTFSIIISTRSEIKFVTLPNGIIQMFPGKAMESTLYVSSSSLVVVVVTSSLFYTASFLKLKFISGQNKPLTGTELKLLFSAFISATPLLLELFRALIQHVAVFQSNNDMIIILTELWYYMIEITIGIEAWIHLSINSELQENWRKFILSNLNSYKITDNSNTP